MGADNVYSLKDILRNVIGRIEHAGHGPEISSLWAEAVGEDLAAHSRAVSCDKGRLVVNVSDSARLYELTTRRQELIKTMNERLTKSRIREIRFKIGDI
ncbi:MAG: DUF721 domain-containing protein [Candidatus Omnitrophota bacterium]